MAWQSYLPDDRVKWTSGWESHPIWPHEPDVSVIKNLIWSKYAQPTFANSLKEQIEVEFLADGAHHNVYNVSHPAWSAPLVFRVAVPVDPTLKMESEMASLRFLSECTTVPVPKCVAWGLAADTELGYDWCLMEKLPGVELRSVWRKMPWEKKLEFADKLAGALSQLWKPDNMFDQIGSIYVLEQATGSPTAADDTTAGDMASTCYVVGPAVDNCFFAGRRRYLQSHRGPFPSCRDWIHNLIVFEREVITTTKTLLDHKEDMTAAHLAMDWESLVEDELEIEGEDEFLQEYDEAIDTVQAYRNLLPELFPDDPSATGQPRFSLFHPDLRDANIFVDPDTFEMTGILDWESAMTMPDWYVRDYPLLFQASEPFDERIPRIPDTYDEEDERYNGALVSTRDRWELRLLRRRYDEALEKLGWKDWRVRSHMVAAQNVFLEGLSVLSSDLDSAKRRFRWVQEGLDEEKQELKAGENQTE
ncbi:phosphotransferase enzyme family-domain-containing protein [Chaetomium fimeti]|uniref:Phosphotransferase enzyme family-domain-containing protein n=1 Tax=Chaetomium fimeti TaxID=1854472 RepID=A0AAE0H5C5_9PEZI|nr:phosphotransferase enzyme family-domain-containing protein [Chaetomium fimeti]